MKMNHPKMRIQKLLITILFIALLLVGLFTIRGYGMPFDEYPEMGILYANLKEYALRFDLDPESNYYANLYGTPISKSIERDHGICAYYPLAPLLPTITHGMRPFSYAWSFLTWIWFFIACLSLYGILRALSLTRALSCVGVLFFYLSPRFFAEGHYNNKDVILLCFVLMTLWAGIKLMQKPGIAKGLLFSLIGAAATNTKIIGGLPWGLIGIALIVMITAKKQWSHKMAVTMVITILSFVLFYLLLTPASWDDPIAFVAYVWQNATRFSRFDGTVLFRGAQFHDIVGATPLPWYYLPYLMLVTIPLYTLFLSAVGHIHLGLGLIKKPSAIVRDDQALFLVVAIAAWILPVGYAMISDPILYNGWRHFYFACAGIVILAAYGMQALWTMLYRKRILKIMSAAIMGLCLVVTVIGLCINHPYQYTYYNFLQPRDAATLMEMDYWNVSGSGAITRLYQLKKETPGILRIGCYFNDIRIAAMKLPDHINDKVIVTIEKDEPYLYYNKTYSLIYQVVDPPSGYHKLFDVMSYGNTVGTMYERDDTH